MCAVQRQSLISSKCRDPVIHHARPRQPGSGGQAGGQGGEQRLQRRHTHTASRTNTAQLMTTYIAHESGHVSGLIVGIIYPPEA